MAWFGTTTAGAKAKRSRHSKRRRAREVAATPEGDPGIDRIALFRAHNGLCGKCGLPVPEDAFELDHDHPLSKGGLHTSENLVPMHPKCNREKAAKVGPRKKGLRRTKFKIKARPLPPHDPEMF